ncbi:uncharacterized protein LOC117117913 isoform X2 [Anneissia japonica]|uniref:uncharacterized protein LOC117117913 isoform X2 n=1 Tax=Anneissia japonica TaxID=1529436 RepID=UPI0014259CC8|nr:uncharacterized protein LOC117117913 isoform X2 [Anneissia japonica]
MIHLSKPITQPVGKRKRHYSNTFQTHGMVLIERMTNLLQKTCSPVPKLLDYLERNGCGVLFPRAVSYVTNPHTKITPIKQAPMDGHFNQASALNQLIALCYQLQHDITSLSNHKYIAHQIALVYQSINQLGNPKVLLDHRTSIETTFKKVKAELEREGETTPHLNADLIFWLQNLTSSLVQSVKTLSADLTGQMRPAMKFILQSTS